MGEMFQYKGNGWKGKGDVKDILLWSPYFPLLSSRKSKEGLRPLEFIFKSGWYYFNHNSVLKPSRESVGFKKITH